MLLVIRAAPSCAILPLAYRWEDGSNPPPVKVIRTRHQPRLGPMQAPPPWLATGPAATAFDFCGHVRRLLHDIVARCQPLGHVDVSRLLVGVTRARNGRAHGLQARVTPLRFSRGELVRRRWGAAYQVQRYFLGDHEFYYLLTFCLPRFLNQEFSDKFITLFHELYHIGPECRGDLRRPGGGRRLHAPNRRKYDEDMAALAREYLAARPEPALHDFLRLNFAQLQHRHGAVAAVVVPHPRIVRVG